ncbi:phosphatase [Photobacterium sanguinicancri]|uniref:Phosphatase n=1 Tax=Photobacterium sanguinicancri TaxID=875932 RepID=A0AAW7XZ78_9GAMM|nr:phosphatase [Photobacterium sanguinicancri]MDO6541441.1 phosphatase [Photobacterium sanguinicancri]OZS42863.1 phosphatase [Photobacterium sanguinicancri]
MKLSVDTHTHTISSGHAYSTVLENAQAAAQRGLSLMCVTDHAPTMPGAPHFWHFANQRVLPRFLHGVGVIRGVETNILNTDGEIDMDARILDMLDWVIGSFHEPIFRPTDKHQHTLALINAIESGRIDAVGHPGNPNFDFDYEAVIRAAANNNVVLEINNSSLCGSRAGSEMRCADIAACIKEFGGRITTGSDAHFAHDVGNFEHVQALLQQVAFPVEQVVTHTPATFLRFLQERGRLPIDAFSAL